MPPPTNLADKYRSQAIQTAPGPQLLVMLYDRLAADVDIAGFSLEAQDYAATNERLQHAQRIVRMLKHSLEPDGFAGGRDLLALYEFLLSHLVEANLRKDPELVRECGRIIAPLREAWQRAVNNPEQSRWPPTSGLTTWRRRASTSARRGLAVEAGRACPPGPSRPTALLPDELRGRAQLLAAGYDQLALEVSTHLTEMQRYRRNHVPQAPPASHFVDQRV